MIYFKNKIHNGAENNSISTIHEIPQNLNKSDIKFKILIISLLFTFIIIIGLLIGIIILASEKAGVKSEKIEENQKTIKKVIYLY